MGLAARPPRLDRTALSFRSYAGDRGCVLLLHGMLASHHYFSSALGASLHPWRLLLPDLLGFGDSVKPDLEFTLADHLSCLADLVVGLAHSRRTHPQSGR